MKDTLASAVLDREQLRDITLDDEELMREILSTLIEDTSLQVPQLESAIRVRDSELCMRLAHYSKGACANVGALAAATVLKTLEQSARDCEFDGCGEALTNLAFELDRLRSESLSL